MGSMRLTASLRTCSSGVRLCHELMGHVSPCERAGNKMVCSEDNSTSSNYTMIRPLLAPQAQTEV